MVRSREIYNLNLIHIYSNLYRNVLFIILMQNCIYNRFFQRIIRIIIESISFRPSINLYNFFFNHICFNIVQRIFYLLPYRTIKCFFCKIGCLCLFIMKTYQLNFSSRNQFVRSFSKHKYPDIFYRNAIILFFCYLLGHQ